jgi:uncharacterized protein (DUF1330 family)
MNAYLVLDLAIHDFERFREYIATIPAFIKKHGGRYVVQGEVPTVMEGDWSPERLVVIEFPSRANAQDFLQDPAAQSLFALRHETTTSKLLLVDGCLMSAQ